MSMQTSVEPVCSAYRRNEYVYAATTGRYANRTLPLSLVRSFDNADQKDEKTPERTQTSRENYLCLIESYCYVLID